MALELGETTNSTLYEEDVQIEIYWKVLIEDLRNFKLELDFNHPNLVSTDGLDPDKILFKFLKP